MTVTVVLSGVPYHVSLDELKFNFNVMFDSAEVSTFRMREINDCSGNRLVALDFDNGYDAMAVQDILDGFEYRLLNGEITKLKAIVSTNPEHLHETPIKDARTSMPLIDDITIVYSTASSNRKCVKKSQSKKLSTSRRSMSSDRECEARQLSSKVESPSDYRNYWDLDLPYTSISSSTCHLKHEDTIKNYENSNILKQKREEDVRHHVDTAKNYEKSNKMKQKREEDVRHHEDTAKNYEKSNILKQKTQEDVQRPEDTAKNYENSNILKQKREEAIQFVLFEINCAVENDKKSLQKSDVKIVTQVFEKYVRTRFKKLKFHKEMLVNEMILCYRRKCSKTEDTEFYQKLINGLKRMDYCAGELEKDDILSHKTTNTKKKKEKSQAICTVDEVLEECSIDLLQHYGKDKITNSVAKDVNNKKVNCTITRKRYCNEDVNPETSKPCKAIAAEEKIKENEKDRNILDVIEISDDDNVATPPMNIDHSNKSLEQVKYNINSDNVTHEITTGLNQSSRNTSKGDVNAEKISETIEVKRKLPKRKKTKNKKRDKESKITQTYIPNETEDININDDNLIDNIISNRTFESNIGAVDLTKKKRKKDKGKKVVLEIDKTDIPDEIKHKTISANSVNNNYLSDRTLIIKYTT